MSDKESAQNVIEAYRKRQSIAQKAPLIFGIAAVLLIVGAGMIIFYLTNPNRVALPFASTATPTSTQTYTPTATSTNTPTVTVTSTAAPTDTETPTLSPTPDKPFVYVVKEGDNLYAIANTFKVDLLTLLALNPSIDSKNPVIHVNQEIIIPAPNTVLDTATAIPPEFRGTIDYIIAPGDSLELIAARYYSTVDAIVKLNKLTNANDIFAGESIKVPVNIATPVPTKLPTKTASPTP